LLYIYTYTYTYLYYAPNWGGKKAKHERVDEEESLIWDGVEKILFGCDRGAIRVSNDRSISCLVVA